METSIQFYDHGRHYKKLCDWMQRHDLGNPKPELMSDLGLVINDTAIGFLFKTNSKMALIDNLVTNITKTAEQRHEALNILLKNLDCMAKRSGFLAIQILCDTKDMDKRLFDLGYRSHGAYSLFYKETGEI